MATATPWQLLRHGENEEALRRMREAYAHDQGPSYVMDLGVAYLWLGRYDAAWEHFNGANRKEPKRYDVYYGMAGAAKWCLDERDVAIRQWQVGCDCEYADGAGGVGAPLHLFIASLLAPELFARSDAEKLLTVRADDPRVECWPGPIAEFILRRIDENGFRRKCAGVNERDTFMRHWLADFYLGVLELSRGNVQRFREAARKASLTSADDFDRTKKQYLGKLWHEEFFIARHEIQGHGGVMTG